MTAPQFSNCVGRLAAVSVVSKGVSRMATDSYANAGRDGSLLEVDEVTPTMSSDDSVDLEREIWKEGRLRVLPILFVVFFFPT